jgi:hypothetical protein
MLHAKSTRPVELSIAIQYLLSCVSGGNSTATFNVAPAAWYHEPSSAGSLLWRCEAAARTHKIATTAHSERQSMLSHCSLDVAGERVSRSATRTCVDLGPFDLVTTCRHPSLVVILPRPLSSHSTAAASRLYYRHGHGSESRRPRPPAARCGNLLDRRR